MPDKYHILMVLDEPFPSDVRVENEARSLIEAGFRVSLLSVAPYLDHSRERTLDHKGLTVIQIHTPRQLRNKMRGVAATIPALSLYVSRQVQRICRQQRVDALHIHDLWLFGAGLRASRRLGLPMIGDLHENYVDALSQYAWSTAFPARYVINLPRWRILETRWTCAASRLICVNEAQKARVVSFGAQPDAVVVTPNTIAISEFDRYEVDRDLVASLRSAFTVLYTGSFDRHRGLDTLIRAMQPVRRVCDAKLVLVGDGRVRTELESLAQSLGLAQTVVFTGWQPQHRIKSYILGSDVGTVPLVKGANTDATTPHKLFHYMYLKRPVLATNCRLMQQVVESAQAGLVVPSASPDAMGQALLKLYREPDLRKKMGQNGHEVVISRYNWDVTVRDLVTMYHDLASG